VRGRAAAATTLRVDPLLLRAIDVLVVDVRPMHERCWT
jgi:hypothetical protein